MPERFRSGAFHFRRYSNALLPLSTAVICCSTCHTCRTSGHWARQFWQSFQ